MVVAGSIRRGWWRRCGQQWEIPKKVVVRSLTEWKIEWDDAICWVALQGSRRITVAWQFCVGSFCGLELSVGLRWKGFNIERVCRWRGPSVRSGLLVIRWFCKLGRGWARIVGRWGGRLGGVQQELMFPFGSSGDRHSEDTGRRRLEVKREEEGGMGVMTARGCDGDRAQNAREWLRVWLALGAVMVGFARDLPS